MPFDWQELAELVDGANSSIMQIIWDYIPKGSTSIETDDFTVGEDVYESAHAAAISQAERVMELHYRFNDGAKRQEIQQALMLLELRDLQMPIWKESTLAMNAARLEEYDKSDDAELVMVQFPHNDSTLVSVQDNSDQVSLTFTPSELAKRLAISVDTLGKLARKAGVNRPDIGDREFVYEGKNLAEFLTWLSQMAGKLSARAKATALLQEHHGTISGHKTST